MYTRRALLASAISLPVARPTLLLACDDPPSHYPDPCHAAVPRTSGYYPIAQSQGFFQENGVSIEIRPFDRADLSQIAESSHVTQLSGPGFINLIISNPSLRVFSTPITRVTYVLWGDGDLFRDKADFRGKKIAAGAAGFGYDIATYNLADNFDLDPRELSIIDVPGTQTRYAAAQSGSVDAAWFPAEDDEGLASLGFDRLFETEFPFARDVFVAPEDELQIRENIPFYTGFLKTISDCVEFMGEFEEESVKIIMEFISTSEQEAREIYRVYSRSEVFPTLDTEALEAVRLSLISAYPGKAELFKEINFNDITTKEIVERSFS